MGTWSVPLEPITDNSAVKRDAFLDELLKSTVKTEPADEPSNVPRGDIGSANSSRDTQAWLFMSSQNKWITGVYDTEHAPKVLVNGRQGAWW